MEGLEIGLHIYCKKYNNIVILFQVETLYVASLWQDGYEDLFYTLYL